MISTHGKRRKKMGADNDQIDVLPGAQAGEESPVRLDSCVGKALPEKDVCAEP